MSAPLLPHEIEIADGLTLADLTTVEACRLALLTLSRDINRIEEQLAPAPAGSQWAERAESALRFKKALRETVKDMIGDLRRAERAAAAATRERVLVEVFKEKFAVEFAAALWAAQQRRPELWKEVP